MNNFDREIKVGNAALPSVATPRPSLRAMALPPSPSASEKAKKYRVLTQDTVIDVFAKRPPRNADGTFKPSSRLSHRLAEEHGISERSVREIWNRRSWTKVTRPLWTNMEIAASLSSGTDEIEGLPKQRRVGRPRKGQDCDATPSLVLCEEMSSCPVTPVLSFSTHVVGAAYTTMQKNPFNDPFEKDWVLAFCSLDLSTMVNISEVSVPSGCDPAWLHAMPCGSWTVTSRQSAIDEIFLEP